MSALFPFAPRRSNWRMRTAALAIAAGLTLLAGCATQPQKAAQATARASNATEYQGRFAVKYVDQNGQVRNAYGNFDWVEQADAVSLSLRNPLGSTLAIVVASPTSATLELPNQPPRTASNVEDLMQSALGFPMPVDGLRYWLQNRPAPQSRAKTTADASGRISQLVQDGWQIDYLGFADATPAVEANVNANAASAPRVVVRRMNLTRKDSTSATPLEVKLVINP